MLWGEGLQDAKEGSFGRIQNDPRYLRYLLARRQVQVEITRLLFTQLMVVIALPAGLAVISFYWPSWKPGTSLVALIIALVDILCIDRMQKASLAKSAKLQEAFDCQVFELEWNIFIAGKPLADTFIDSKAAGYACNARAGTVKNWYPERLSELPPSLGRIAAQTLNMLYDEWLRTHYRVLVGLPVILILGLLIFFAAVEDVNLTALLLGVLVPTAPLINWCSREVFRQHDALTRLRTTRALNEALWEQALVGDLPAMKADTEARHTQDVSYIRRSTSPAIFEHLYWIRRSSLERRMSERADSMIQMAAIATARDT